MTVEVEVQDIGGYTFTKACDIQPLRDTNGVVVPFFPHKNETGLPLHRYGEGPFCEFKVTVRPGLLIAGVYIIFVITKLKYIGKCEGGLSRRFNDQYGKIVRSDCLKKGGRQTNCRLNHLIYLEALQNNGIAVWFFATPKFKQIEHELIGRFQPFPPDGWNLP